MNFLKRLFLICVISAPWLSMSGWLLAASLTETQLLNKANQLIKQKKADEAYKMLLPLESTKAGKPAFDYMLGVSAMESGDLSNAVFALQRAVAMKPDFVGAKMDLARSYYKLNELREAKQEFESILQYKPSERLQDIIGLYLSNIQRKQQKNVRRGRTNVSVTYGLGYDSNANSAPQIESYLGIDLNEDSRQKPSGYVTTSANLNYISPLSSNQTITFNASTNLRENNNTSFVNNMAVIAGGGYIQKLRGGQLSLSSQLFQAYVVGKYSGRNIAGITQYTTNGTNGQKIGLMANISGFRANAAGSVRDANQYVLGLNFISSLKKSKIPDTVISFSTGKSSTLDPQSPYGKVFSSARFMLSKKAKLKYALLLKASSSVSSTIFSGQFNGVDRRETATNLEISSDVLLDKKLKLTLSSRYNTNNSTIDIYTFSRYEYKAVMQWMLQ